MLTKWFIASCTLMLLAVLLLYSSIEGNYAGAQDGLGPTVYVGFQNETGEDIVFFVGSRKSGFSNPPFFLKSGDVKSILCYDDHKDRALVAFNMKGDKVLSQFAFEPAFLLFSIQKNWRKDVAKERIEKADRLSSVPH